MADSKLSALGAVTTLDPSDELYVNAGGDSKKVTNEDLLKMDTAAADTDGADREITAESGGAHTSNNPDGGDVVLRPGAKGSGGSGANGKAHVVVVGGTIGQDDVEIAHLGASGGHIIFRKPSDSNGTGYLLWDTVAWQFRNVGQGYTNAYAGRFVTAGGNSPIQLNSLSASEVNFGSDVKMRWGNSTGYNATKDTGFKRGQAGVVQCDGAGNGGCVEFLQVSDVPNPSSNCGIIGAEDVSGTAEVIVADEAGTEAQLTAHRMDGPSFMYDSDELLQQVGWECNRYAGYVRYVNAPRDRWLRSQGLKPTLITTMPWAAKNGVLLLANATDDQKSRCVDYFETLDDFNARTGKNKQLRVWEDDQNTKQTNYDAIRAQEAQRHTEWTAADIKTREPEPFVPPARDIRKPKPAIVLHYERAKTELEGTAEPGLFSRALKFLGLR